LNSIFGLSNNKTIEQFVDQYLTVVSETPSEYACYCPFHSNTSSPAFYVNKKTGLWHCFNPSCGRKGSFATLAKELAGKEIAWNYQPHYSDDELINMLEDSGGALISVPEDWGEAMERITVDYRNRADVEQNLSYLLERGYTESVLEHFEIGYSARQERIVIPARDEFFNVVGFIGRATSPDQHPKYLYSGNFPRRTTLFNLQNAKAYREVILTEGSLDAIKVHQSGFPNVVATLGASIPSEHHALLSRYFDSLVLFFDNDDAGRAARRAIIEGNPRKDVWIVPYPSGVKDPGEMTEQQIRESIKNKINYLDWLFQDKEKTL
jgi:DNA primase